MSKTIKAAVIGCGGAARIDHIRWYAQHPDVALVGSQLGAVLGV